MEDCETEQCDFFLFENAGASDARTVLLKANTINNPVFVGAIDRVVGIGNSLYANVTLGLSGAKWTSLGDRGLEDFSLTVVPGAIFANQDTVHAGGYGEQWGVGHITWQPGLSNVYPWEAGLAGEQCTRSGWRGQPWASSVALPSGYPVGTIVQPTVDNGLAYISSSGTAQGTTEPTWPAAATIHDHAMGFLWTDAGPAALLQTTPWAASTHYALNSAVTPTSPNGRAYVNYGSAGTSGGTEPSWPASSTVTDNTITWTENGPSGAFAGFGPLDHYKGTAAPSSGYWRLASIVWNTSPANGSAVGWVCTAAGSPGTWYPFGVVY